MPAKGPHAAVQRCLFAGVLSAWGCGASDPTGTPPPPEGLAYEPCPAAARVGGFNVQLATDFTAVEGRVATGVVPANIRTVASEDGACRLLRGRTLFCDPACGASQTCGEAGACVPFPTAKSVGSVTVTGLKVDLTMMPSSVGFYSNGATTIPHPGVDPGGAIALVASGGELPGFTLHGEGITPLVLSAGDIVVERGRPVSLSWAPPAAVGPGRIRALLDLAHHGGIAASIDCDGLADTGSFEIPAGLVSALLDLGVAGFPKITVTRRTADAESIAPGCVDLLVTSSVERVVTIPGLRSCTAPEECPMGETCQADLTCR